MGNVIHDINHQPLSEENWKPRFSLAMLASFAVHLALAWLITLSHSEPPIREKKTPPVMDVVLLDESKVSNDSTANDARTIANKSSSGQQQNATDDRTRAARSPDLNGKRKPEKQHPATPKAAQLSPAPKQQTKKNTKLLARDDDNSPSLLPPEQDMAEERKSDTPPVPNIPLANLLPPSAALTQLSREYDRERRMKQLLSKEADIGINTREAKFAPYAQGLVRALEELWQPDGASIQSLAVTERQVFMSVSIANNGELVDLKVIRPSPSQELNDSAIAAVHAAAPFKPLPTSWGLERANFYFIFEVVEDRPVFRTL